MDGRRGRGGRNRNVFKGAVLVSILLETHPRRFKARLAAVRFAKRLLREGYIKSIFGSRSFEDSAQLYMWQDDDAVRLHRATMTSSGASDGVTSTNSATSQQERIQEAQQRAGYESLRREETTEPRYERLDIKLIEDVKNKVLNRSEAYNIVTSYNTFFQELQQDFRGEGDRGDRESEQNYYNQPPQRQNQHQQQHSMQSGDSLHQKPHHQQQPSIDSYQQQRPQQPGDSQHQKSQHHRQASIDSYRQQYPQQSGDSYRQKPQQGSIDGYRQQQQQSGDFYHHRPQEQSGDNRRPQKTQPLQQIDPRHQQQTSASESSQHRHRVKPQQQQHQPSPSTQREGSHRLNDHRQQQTPNSHHPQSQQQSRRQPQTQPANTPHRSQAFSSGTYHDPYAASTTTSADVKRESTCSTDSSVDTQTYFRTRDRISSKTHQQQGSSSSGGGMNPRHSSSQHSANSSIPHASMTSPATNHSHTAPPQQPALRDHNSIPEERISSSDPALMNAGMPPTDKNKELRPDMTSSEYEMTSVGTMSLSHPQVLGLASNNVSSSPEHLAITGSGSGVVSQMALVDSSSVSRSNRWAHEPAAYSYSDNEKQLIEEMKRMKKEHQDILRTYEGRINKLMAKMHELRNIAEMLENSSTKTSPYGLLPGKATLLNIIASGTKLEDSEKKGSVTGEGDVPPPLPPRPGRGGRIYPNKPIIHTRTRMKSLHWNRIILAETGTEGGQTTVWHGMPEAKFDTEQVDRLYSTLAESSNDDVTLLDDIYTIRGRPKHQLLAMFDAERSQRILTEMRSLRCSLSDVISAISSLECQHLHQDSFAELLELLNSPRDVDKILHHVKRKGPGQLDTPEYLIFEMSKLDHFRERLEFLRFKNKLQINLFEIDQQLRELNTACDELVNNVPLKNVLQTVLAVGNYLNGGTERGQADGFGLDVLNKLKDFADRSRRGNLLELIMRTYCLQYESDLDLGCPTRFKLPEPSNMRHAAQVSFEEIQKALRDLREELSQVRDRLEVLSKRESSNLTIALRVTSENFLTSAVEVLAEEKRFLEDTKGHFWKTTAYFHYTRQCAPQEFFLIWATFLHDCKYYWKLAHRNLARDKFERDFSTKCQLSCSSLPGFTNLKNKMMRTVATLQNDQEMRASKAQQLLHINNWIESLGRYDQDVTPQGPHLATRENAYGNGPSRQDGCVNTTPGQRDRKQQRHRQREQGGGSGSRQQQQQQQLRSSSPKPITSTPPNVHKPQAISHISPTTVSSTYSSTSFPTTNAVNGTGSAGPNSTPYALNTNGEAGNYHPAFHCDGEMEEPYESLSRVTMAMTQEGEPVLDFVDGNGKRLSQDSTQKKNAGNFSIKSWLKRDQRQRSSNDELSSPNGQSSQYPAGHNSAKSPTTPFNKLRNSVVQKFAGTGSSKKSGDSTKANNTPVVPPKPPRTHTENEPIPSHLILFSPGQQQQGHDSTEQKHGSQDLPGDYEPRDYQNFYYQAQGSKDRGFPTGHDSAPSTLSSVTSRDFSPQKYEALSRGDVSRHRDTSRDKSRYGGQEENFSPSREPVQHLAPPSSTAEPAHKERRGGRSRAPIAINLGSNMSISDAYGRQDDGQRQSQQPPQQTQVTPQTQYPHHLAAESGRDVHHVSPQYPASHPAGDSSSRDATPHLPPQPCTVDSKRVKANPVPVYKAKLIPNYENQTKMDPRMEPAIRGQAEPVHEPAHFAHSSNSSEVYRQELQKKSEMYLNSYPQSPLSQTPPCASSFGNVPTANGSQTPPGQGSYPHASHGGAQGTPNQNAYPPSQGFLQTPLSSSYPNPNQDFSQTPPSHGPAYPQQSPFSQTTPTATASCVSMRDGGFGPVNPNSTDYDDFQTPARRSASAQNILDRGGGGLFGTDGSRASHTSDPSGPSHSYLASFSAKRDGEKGNGQGTREVGRNKAADPGQPAKVLDLIHRWEKKDGTMGGPLVDGADKPPSMTSTPVTRRKHPAGSLEGEDRGSRSATVPPQSQRHHQPMTSSYDSQGTGSGVGPFVSGGSARSRSQSQGRERGEHRDSYPRTHPHHSQSPHRAEPVRHNPQTPRSQGYPSPHQQQQPYSPQTPNSTNTYPPRSSIASSGRSHPTDPNSDAVDSYSDQLRKASQFNGERAGGGEGGQQTRPVPLPRHNIPGAMAVVKPTVMHQGALTFMEI
ncbi:hypothetical protein V1264_000538 [Littorina saxatilis]|uniref:Uncharacterized protein n=2 Tax=Littorina saxatilis TaxID=31220 RepID=A0AAN9GMW3_9CAEN